MLPEEFIPVSRVYFEEFNTEFLNVALRNSSITDLRSLTILVSQKTHDLYVRMVLNRMEGNVNADTSTFKPMYAGVPVEINEEIPDNMVEIYGPAVESSLV